LLAEKAWHLLVRKRMLGVHKDELVRMLSKEIDKKDFNLYSFVNKLN
jgi:hypothetical protein